MNNVYVKADAKVNVDVKVEDVKVQDLKSFNEFNYLKHLQMLHGSSDGWITLALKINGNYTQRHYKYNDLIEQLKDCIENFDINNHANIYISQNTFYKPQRRNKLVSGTVSYSISYSIKDFRLMNNEIHIIFEEDNIKGIVTTKVKKYDLSKDIWIDIR